MHGWIWLDKPAGITSTQALGKVRRIVHPQKIGHGGTLDPLATGVLPLALGEATKTIPYVMDHRKRYRFTVRWGQARNTDDAEGEVTARSDVRPTQAEIMAVLPRFMGEIAQVPPAFSAVKVDGRRAYAAARAGEEVQLKSRTVTIHAMRLEAVPSSDEAVFSVACSKGTYVRSLARDMGEILGCYGHITALRRTAVGKIGEQCIISLDKLEELVHSAPAERWLHPCDAVLDDILAWHADEDALSMLRHGQCVPCPVSVQRQVHASERGAVVRVYGGDIFAALAKEDAGILRPTRIFNL